MFRLIRALWYYCTGRFSKGYQVLMGNEYVMGATYDQAISKQEHRFQAVRESVASLMSIKLQNTERIKALGAEIEKLTNVKNGAGIAAKKRAEALQTAGKEEAAILADPEVIKWQGIFHDAASTLKAKQEETKVLEAQLAERSRQIASYTAELQQMQRNVVNLRQEKHTAIADTQIAKQQKAINDALAGIADDTTDKDLQAAREAHRKAINEATISADLAGADASRAEAEALHFAEKAAADSEFASLLNLGGNAQKEAPTPVAETPTQPAQLPSQ